MSERVAVIGAGLAGLAAAIRLVDAGMETVVLESRKKIGGRAGSFIDPRTGTTYDNCQHVVMGCCTNLLDFYDRIGVLDRIEWFQTLHWTAGGGRIDTLRPGMLPAPLHLARSFSRLSLYSLREKRHIARGMWRILRMGSAGRVEWANRTFGEFLRHCGQPEEVVRRFWNTIIVSACNLEVERVGAAYALQVFQEGFLGHRWAGAMGLPRVPLGDLYAPAIEYIEQRGGSVVTGASVQAIKFDGKRVRGVVTRDDFIPAETVMATVSPDRLMRLVSDSFQKADTRLQQLDQFQFSPILGVHLKFDRAIMSTPHLVLVDFDTHWLFNKGLDSDGRQYVHAVISAADSWMALDESEIVRRVVADIHRAIPGSVGLEPVKARAIKEKRATFAPTPESHEVRPSGLPGTIGLGGGGVPNLYLAGDWVDTGWPATMEGAVRSGYTAAEAICGSGGLIPDLPAGFLARLLGLR